METGSSASPDDSDPAPPARLALKAVDAVNDIQALFLAYQGLESLLMPRGVEPADQEFCDRELFALLSLLNKPMGKQILAAKEASAHLLDALKDTRSVAK